ncbi:hypothetical protein ACFL2V_11300 [Pseudomonadota bacterium]
MKSLENKQAQPYGILEGTVRTALDLAGMIPVGIVNGLSKPGGTVNRYIESNRHKVRQTVGAAILLGVGLSVVD